MKKILISILAVAIVAALIGAGSFAYFTDTETSTLNVFTAGSLDLALQGGTQNPADADSVIATWESPDGWAPGDPLTGTLMCTNEGSVAAQHIYFYFQNVAYNGGLDGSNLMDKIIVTGITERFTNTVTDADTVTGNQALKIEQQLTSYGGANGDNILTLKELANWGPGYYTWDDQSGDNILLAAGDKADYDLIFTFEFDSSAGDIYQGDTCGFDLRCVATQNSLTDGMIALH